MRHPAFATPEGDGRVLKDARIRRGVSWPNRRGVRPHLYRAMAWLGEPLPTVNQDHAHASRCVRDRFGEALFLHHLDLFTELDPVFFDTAPLYFTG